jgi:two-component system, response regulator, stage 0 sporulation protein F
MATILIIDDEESVRALLRFALESAGYGVTEAANGHHGLELYRHRSTDLIITDIAMPELNELDMILELTRQFLHAKVIAISGAGGEQNVLDVAKLLGARQTSHAPVRPPAFACNRSHIAACSAWSWESVRACESSGGSIYRIHRTKTTCEMRRRIPAAS